MNHLKLLALLVIIICNYIFLLCIYYPSKHFYIDLEDLGQCRPLESYSVSVTVHRY